MNGDPVKPDRAAARGVVSSGICGNIIEWYDFALYGYLAPVTATLFFPSSDHLSSLIAAFAVFAVGALARPFGGLLFGHIGDRAGRRTALITSIALMGASTAAMGLLPTHASVGVAAPILLLLLRLAQGVSTGGEFSGSITFLVEHAPPRRQGLFGSLANLGGVIGGALGAGVAWLATGTMTTETLHTWGWRIPFLCALPISLAGLWFRLHVADTPAYLAMKERGTLDPAPLRTALRTYKAAMATVFGLNWVVSSGYYIVFVWLVTAMTSMAGLELHTAMAIGTVGLLFGGAVTLLAGDLSDRLGRRVLLWTLGLATTFGAVPLLLMANSGGPLPALGAQLALATLVGGYLGVMPAVLAAQMPSRVRCSGLSMGYNLAVALFGGTAPLIATLLVKVTGWSAAPGLYLVLSAVVGLALVHRAVDRAPEASPRPRRPA